MNLSTFSSKKLPRASLIACAMIVLTIIIAGSYLFAMDSFPAPMFTGRISVDEKMKFVRENIKPGNLEVVAMGSSMAQNNIISRSMLSIPGLDGRYFNFSSFHLGPNELLELGSFLTKFYKPKIMIICITPNEFTLETNFTFNENDLKDYLNGAPSLPHYVKYYDINFIRRMAKIRRHKKANKYYDSLNFDDGGGVILDVPRHKTRKKQWEHKIGYDFKDHNYSALDKMISMLKK